MPAMGWFFKPHRENVIGSPGEKVINCRTRLQERRNQGPSNLITYVTQFRASRSLDPRDKVYALVALAADGGDFPIDYTKSTFSVICDLLEKGTTCRNLNEILGVTFKGLQTAYPRHYTALDLQSGEEEDSFRAMGYYLLDIILDKIGYVLKDGDVAMNSEYERARMSLENARVRSILDWLESEDYEADSLVSRYEKALIYRRWPLRFPVELRPMVKLHMLMRWRASLQGEKDLLVVWRGATLAFDRDTCRCIIIEKPKIDEGDVVDSWNK
jgi:hypothetical protein